MDLVRGRMQRFRRLIVGGLAIGCAFVLYRAASAQGPGDPDLRLIRATNDQPNLAATAPRTADGKPDLSGVWRSASAKYLTNLAADGIQVSFQPWAAALFKERQKADSKDRPSGRCLPSGVPSVMLARDTLEDRPDPWSHPDPVRRISSLSSDLHRRPRLSRRCRSELVRLFDWQVGRRYLGGRDGGAQRGDVD